MRDTEGEIPPDDTMLSAEQIRDKEDQSAEIAAASVLSAKRTEAFANNKFSSGNRSGFFTDADKEVTVINIASRWLVMWRRMTRKKLIAANPRERMMAIMTKNTSMSNSTNSNAFNLLHYRVPVNDEEELSKSLSVQPEDSTMSDEGKPEEIKPSLASTRASAEKATEVDSPRAPPTSTKKKKKVHGGI